MMLRVKQKNGARSRGYTVVEVMSAMTLFAIGAAGVIGMQRVTIQGGADARNFDIATNIAREWEHRLQRDALSWTEPNSVVTSSNLDSTHWLATSNITNAWRVPAVGAGGGGGAVAPVDSAAFDLLGHDIDPTSPDHVFCVHYKLDWIAENQTGNKPTGLIRAEVRVVWARLESAPPACSDLTVDAPANRNRYHFVNVATAIRGNPNQ